METFYQFKYALLLFIMHKNRIIKQVKHTFSCICIVLYLAAPNKDYMHVYTLNNTYMYKCAHINGPISS